MSLCGVDNWAVRSCLNRNVQAKELGTGRFCVERMNHAQHARNIEYCAWSARARPQRPCQGLCFCRERLTAPCMATIPLILRRHQAVEDRKATATYRRSFQFFPADLLRLVHLLRHFGGCVFTYLLLSPRVASGSLAGNTSVARWQPCEELVL